MVISKQEYVNNLRALIPIYLKNDLCVIPFEYGKKEPAPELITWRKYQSQKSTKAEVNEWFKRAHNIAVVGGKISGNLMVIDVDDPGLYEQTLHKYLEAYYEKTWVVETPSGGKHIYFRLPFAVRTKRTSMKRYGVEVLSEGVCIMLPPSVYLDDNCEKHYRLLKPINELKIHTLSVHEIEQLNQIGLALEPINEADSKRKNEKPKAKLSMIAYRLQPQPFRAVNRPEFISAESWDMLHFGLYEKYGYFPKEKGSPKTRSEAEFKICVELIRENNFSFEQVWDVFDKYANDRSKYREKTSAARVSYLHTTYKNARIAVEKGKTQMPMNVEIWYERASNIEWRKISQPSMYAVMSVYHVLLKLAVRLVRSTDLGISEREIEIQSGFGRQAIRTGIEILIENKLISKKRGSDVRKSSRYDLIQRNSDRKSSDQKNEHIFREYGKYQDLDVFRYRGHGKGGLIVYLIIDSNAKLGNVGLTAAEIAIESGMSMSAIYKKLQEMEKSGLLAKEKSKWLIKSSDFEGAAKALQVYGLAEKQRKLHDNERRAYEQARLRKEELFKEMILPRITDICDPRIDRLFKGSLLDIFGFPVLEVLPEYIIDKLINGDVEPAISDAGKIYWRWARELRYSYKKHLNGKGSEKADIELTVH